MISDIVGVRNFANVKAIITSLRKECSPTYENMSVLKIGILMRFQRPIKR